MELSTHLSTASITLICSGFLVPSLLLCYFKEIARNAAALKEVLAKAEELEQEENRALASL